MARLLLADDHPIFLDGLARFLTLNGHSVEARVSSTQQALAAANGRIDVYVIDYTMPGGGGLHFLRALRSAGVAKPIVFLTASVETARVEEAITLGVAGIVLKETAPGELLRCLATVTTGGRWIDPVVQARLGNAGPPAESERLSQQFGLTGREAEIVGLVSLGLRNREIADRCRLTEGTVKVHLHNIFQKVRVDSRAQLIRLLADAAPAR